MRIFREKNSSTLNCTVHSTVVQRNVNFSFIFQRIFWVLNEFVFCLQTRICFMFVKYEVSVINHGNVRANLRSSHFEQCTITRNNHKTIVQTKFSKFWKYSILGTGT